MFSLSSLSIIEVLSSKLIGVAFKLLIFFLLFSLWNIISDKMLQMYLDFSPTVLCRNLWGTEAACFALHWCPW